MIFLSKGQSAASPFVFRDAGRVTSIMGIHRSTLSRHSILFLFVLLGAPVAARCDALEDSARELARKIVAGLPARDITLLTPRYDVAVEINNSSSLVQEETDRIGQTLKSEFQLRGVVLPSGGEIHANVLITLSENFEKYVWTAEILHGDKNQIEIVTCSRPIENRLVSSTIRMTLHGEKFWEEPNRILDVNFDFLSNLEQRLILLLPDGLIITKPEKGAILKKIEFPNPEKTEREPVGDLSQLGNNAESVSNGRVCTVVLDTGTLVRCEKTKGPYDVLGETVLPPDKPRYGDQVKKLPSYCGLNDPFIASGMGDYTQPDTAEVFENKSPVSNELNFPGPILKFSQGQDTQFVTAIVHNLKDGNYELYRISIFCTQ